MFSLRIALLIATSLGVSATLRSQEIPFTTSDGVKLYVKKSGKGEACLYVHGGPGQGTASFEQMRGNRLEDVLTMIYLDQRGSGRSGSSTNYSLDRMVKDIEEVRKALGLKKLNLLAHSFGGVIAVNYAKRYPKRVSRLIMVNATVHFYSDETLKQQIAFAGTLTKEDFPIADNISRGDLEKLLLQVRSELNKADISYKIVTNNVETIQKMIQVDRNSNRNLEFGAAIMRDRPHHAEYYADYAPITSRIRVPVLVLTGSTDHAVGPDHFKRFQFPSQTVIVIPGGHMPYYDNSDMFVRSIADFFNDRR